MEHMRRNISNMTDITQEMDNSSYNATIAAVPTASTGVAQQAIPTRMIAIIGIAIAVVGCLANVLVLAVLIRARRKSGGNVVTLIINQSTLDLLACISVIATYVGMITHGYKYNGKKQVVDNVVCVVLESGLFAAMGLTASNFGLVVITLERYFKIVHAVAHRKHYRKWMTSVAVALPWIEGASLIALPSIGTSRIVNGVCRRFSVWPNAAMAKAFPVVRFMFNYPIPLSVFAFCYARIFHVIRRQSKVVGGQAGRIQVAPAAGTSRDQGTGQIQQQATGATTGAKLSRTEMNVLQTMIAVIVCFILCWSAGEIANFLHLLGVVTVQRNTFMLTVLIGFINPSVNPLIYASRYEVFRRTLKEILGKTGTASNQVSNEAP